MADKSIADLDRVPGSINTSSTLFPVMQSGASYKVTGADFISALSSLWGSHGGIASITKTGTSGLNDTYTITYADDTTTTFVVSNGNGITDITQYWAVSESNTTAPSVWYTTVQTLTNTDKYLWSYFSFAMGSGTPVTTTPSVIGTYGDQGDAWYLYVKYTDECTGTPPYPASDADISDTMQEWIGICSTDQYDEAPTSRFAYTWYKIKGDKGDPPALDLSLTKVEYQVWPNSQIIPMDEWYPEPPAAVQGQYLWTRTTLKFEDAEPIVSYSVSRYGTDGTGTGTVTAIDNILPDAEGNVTIGSYRDCIRVTLPGVSSSNLSFTVTGVTANHELIQKGTGYLSNPSAARSDIGIVTGTNSIVVSGVFSGSTDITISLGIPQKTVSGTAAV